MSTKPRAENPGTEKPRSEKPLIEKTEEEWREQLSPEEFQVARRAGTERAFTGRYWDLKDPGTYRCICCDEPLFRSNVKFDSGSGWPSFWEAIDPDKVILDHDHSHGMHRVEAKCARCDAHLGHVFPDGPEPTGQRFCINSCSLRFEEGDDDGGDDTGS